MALSTQYADEDAHDVLIAKLDNARNVSNILKAIHFKEVSKKKLRLQPVEITADLLIFSLLLKKIPLCRPKIIQNTYGYFDVNILSDCTCCQIREGTTAMEGSLIYYL